MSMFDGANEPSASSSEAEIMAYNEELMVRIRSLLAGQRSVKEKKMFSGVTFMVNGKMCVSTSHERILCRIDPALHEEAISKEGCRAMRMKGKELRGWVFVSEDAIQTKKELEYWVGLALDFNRRAKSSKKKG